MIKLETILLRMEIAVWIQAGKNHIRNCLLSSYVHHYSEQTTNTITFELLFYIQALQHVACTYALFEICKLPNERKYKKYFQL